MYLQYEKCTCICNLHVNSDLESLVLQGHGGVSSVQTVVLHLQRHELALHLKSPVVHLGGEGEGRG